MVRARSKERRRGDAEVTRIVASIQVTARRRLINIASRARELDETGRRVGRHLYLPNAPEFGTVRLEFVQGAALRSASVA